MSRRKKGEEECGCIGIDLCAIHKAEYEEIHNRWTQDRIRMVEETKTYKHFYNGAPVVDPIKKSGSSGK